MITLAFVAGVAVVALGLLARKWKSGAASMLLGALPIALLFLVLPIAPAIWGMIRRFQQMAQSGTAEVKLAAALCLGVSRPLFWGSLACVGERRDRPSAGCRNSDTPRDLCRRTGRVGRGHRLK